MNYGGLFDGESLNQLINQLENKTHEENFWTDPNEAEKVIKELNEVKSTVGIITNLRALVEEINTLIDLLTLEFDSELQNQFINKKEELEKTLQEARVLLLLSGPYDAKDCILEIHAGAGGTEACDWALMLYRMYLRWCEKHHFKVELLEYLDGEEAGVKSVAIMVKGIHAYGYLKGEKGVHRLVRLSPFDANNKRHTSFASIDITPEFDKDIEVNIQESDLKIDVYRASGAGGQHVNTTDSAVRITHLPTKIVVTCQNERSQIQNREMAMRMLKNKLYLLEMEKQNEQLNAVKGVHQNIEFGSQIRSYVMHPYSLVKDHRSNIETSNVGKVLDGEIDLFIEGYLKGGN